MSRIHYITLISPNPTLILLFLFYKYLPTFIIILISKPIELTFITLLKYYDITNEIKKIVKHNRLYKSSITKFIFIVYSPVFFAFKTFSVQNTIKFGSNFKAKSMKKVYNDISDESSDDLLMSKNKYVKLLWSVEVP